MSKDLVAIFEQPHARILQNMLDLHNKLPEVKITSLAREYMDIYNKSGESFLPEDAFYVLFNRYRSKLR